MLKKGHNMCHDLLKKIDTKTQQTYKTNYRKDPLPYSSFRVRHKKFIEHWQRQIKGVGDKEHLRKPLIIM